jgi:hypothetical protein
MKVEHLPPSLDVETKVIKVRDHIHSRYTHNNKWGEPAAGYKWTSWVQENNQLKFKTSGEFYHSSKYCVRGDEL